MSRAFISGCSGLQLSDDEISFFRQAEPWGLILFARNCDRPDQVISLVSAFRDAVGRPDAPVLIDQEGGRVQRLKPPHWRAYPAAGLFGRAYRKNSDEAVNMAWALGRCIAGDLARLGISMNCAPVADIPVAGAHDIIGDRAFSAQPAIVSVLAGAMARGLMSGGIVPIVKHIPGHGRAMVDSHLELPRVEATGHTLRQTDFKPFGNLKHLPAAMTAHVIFSAFDASLPATLSQPVVDQVIREEIGFEGLLISDDLSMQALSGSLSARASRSFRAGLDVVLHCNGILQEMEEVASAAPKLVGDALERCAKALSVAEQSDDSDPVELGEKLLNWAAKQ